ncbi:MAG: hypothetical protein R2695_11170 [Acidimicrobiales bacterium]
MGRRIGFVVAVVATVMALGATALAVTPTGNEQANDPQVGGDPTSNATAVFPTNKQNEPTIAQNPTDGRFLIAGSNDEQRQPACGPGLVRGDTVDSDCSFFPGVGTSGVYTSSDGGLTWTNRGLLDDQASWQGRGIISDGDPVIAYGPKPDGQGGFTYANGARAYYSSLATVIGAKGFEYIIVSYSDDNGLLVGSGHRDHQDQRGRLQRQELDRRRHQPDQPVLRPGLPVVDRVPLGHVHGLRQRADDAVDLDRRRTQLRIAQAALAQPATTAPATDARARRSPSAPTAPSTWRSNRASPRWSRSRATAASAGPDPRRSVRWPTSPTRSPGRTSERRRSPRSPPIPGPAAPPCMRPGPLARPTAVASSSPRRPTAAQRGPPLNR